MNENIDPNDVVKRALLMMKYDLSQTLTENKEIILEQGGCANSIGKEEFLDLAKETIEKLIAEHSEAPHLRVLQKRLAEEITVMVHSQADLENAIAASNAFFSPSMDELKKLDEKTFLEVFDGVPQAEISKDELSEGLDMIAALSAKTNFLASNSDARRELKQNAISLNKEKVAEDYKITSADLINNQFLLLQKGKKNYYVIKVR